MRTGAHNKSMSLLAPSAGAPSSSLTGQYSLFFSQRAFSSENALDWDSDRFVTATGASSGTSADVD